MVADMQPSNHLDIEGIDALIDALKAFKGGVISIRWVFLCTHGLAMLTTVTTSDLLPTHRTSYGSVLKEVSQSIWETCRATR